VPMVTAVGRQSVDVAASVLRAELVSSCLLAVAALAQGLQVLAVPRIAACADRLYVIHFACCGNDAALLTMPTERFAGQVRVPQLPPG